MVKALLAVAATAVPHHVSSRREYLKLRSKCHWTEWRAEPWKVDVYGSEATEKDGEPRPVRSSWCVRKAGTDSWLGIARIDLGPLLPNVRYINAGGSRGVVVSARELWRKVPHGKPYLAGGLIWPNLDDAVASYPPVHTHHAFISFAKTGPQCPAASALLRFHADSYCEERDDKCLWSSLQQGFGLCFEAGSDLKLHVYLETLAAAPCPRINFPRATLTLEVALNVVFPDTKYAAVLPQFLPMPAGDPSNLSRETDTLFTPHIMESPPGARVVSWAEHTFAPGAIVPLDQVDGHVKMHSHTVHMDTILLIKGSQRGLGLTRPPFHRDTNAKGHAVPMVLATDDDVADVKRRLWTKLTNGAQAAAALDWVSLRNVSGRSATLLCAWTRPDPPARRYECDTASVLYDGFDRRANMIEPPGGNCAPTFADARTTFTWVFFNAPSDRRILHHATFWPIYVGHSDLAKSDFA